MNRRSLLKASAAASLGAALGLGARRALGSGDLPEQILPTSERAYNILECFLYGGLTTWETFYCVEEYGRPDDPDPALRGTQYHAFNQPGNTALADALAQCNLGAPALTYFGLDAAQKKVHLGPLVAPLIDRKDVLSRMRVVVTRHDLEPHEAAIPLALCGRTLGAPHMASMGAHVARFFAEHDGDKRRSPFSYAFATNAIPGDNVLATTATGMLPGSSRPLLIKVDATEQLSDLLGRGAVGTIDERARHDALLQRYIDRYRARLRHKGGDPLRSPRLDALAQAARSVRDVDGVQAVLDPSLFTPAQQTLCADTALNLPAMSLKLAAHLLTHPTERARHCCVVDGGLIAADGGGGYDSHAENSYTQTRNLRNFLLSLLPLVNEPGEKDPAKIDLDRTMITFTMEFGRSPQRQGDLGRNHWPYGYVTVYIGGPIKPDRAGLHGAIGPDGHATTYVTPAEHRIACMLALGIWPFFSDSFGVSDVQNVTTELDAARSVAARVLGYAS